MRALYIARHGHREDFPGASRTPTWELSAGRPHDPALSAGGRQQARALGVRLKDREIAQIFTSPFLRAVETAHLVAEIVDAPVSIEDGFEEWLNPDWFSSPPTLLAPAELKTWFPRIEVGYRTNVRCSYPEIVEERDVWPRVARALEMVLQNTTGSTLIVGHGSSVAGMIRALCGPDAAIEARMCALFHFEQSTSRFWEMVLGDCTEHLDAPEWANRGRAGFEVI